MHMLKEKTVYGINLLAIILVFTASTSIKADINEVYNVIEVDTTEVLTMAEVMPEIVGGLKEVYKNIDYPSAAIQNNIEGRVFIRFVVDENGDVKNPEVLKDIGAGCGEAAIKGIKKVKFTPGKQNGQPVSVYFTLPVTFKIEN